MKKELLINGDKAFDRILQRIRESKKSIRINMFIWRDDRIGNAVAQELLGAADRGVKIEIVKDTVGSIFEKGEECRQSMLHKEFNLMVAIKAYVLLLGYFRHVWRLDSKQKASAVAEKMLFHPNIAIKCAVRNDHSKFYIFDDETLIMGGINIEDKELYLDFKQKKWCDYMIEIIDKGIVSDFVAKYNNPTQKMSNSDVDFYFNINAKNIYQVKNKLFELMDRAKKSIDIEMAYFGDPEVTRKIIECANRGIAVSILTSKESNIQTSLNMQILNEIVARTRGKAAVFLSDRVVHSKLLCVDDEVMFFGSANYNKKGMIELSELNILFKVDADTLNVWRTWRREHIDRECSQHAGSKKLKYSKVYAMVESVMC